MFSVTFLRTYIKITPQLVDQSFTMPATIVTSCLSKRCAQSICNPNGPEFAALECKYDHEIVSEAMKENDYARIYAVQEHKANHEIVLETVKQNGHTLEYAMLDWKPDHVVVALRADRPVVPNSRRLWEWACTVVAPASPVHRLERQRSSSRRRRNTFYPFRSPVRSTQAPFCFL